MRRFLLLLTTAALIDMNALSTAFGQSHEVPALSSCIKEFYDPGMYNYLTYKNTCAQSVTVVFVAKDGSGGGGSMDLRPGASDSVGRLAGGAVPKIGQYELYVCQIDYVPVDDNNNVVKKPKTAFQCRPKAQ